MTTVRSIEKRKASSAILNTAASNVPPRLRVSGGLCKLPSVSNSVSVIEISKAAKSGRLARMTPRAARRHHALPSDRVVKIQACARQAANLLRRNSARTNVRSPSRRSARGRDTTMTLRKSAAREKWSKPNARHRSPSPLSRYATAIMTRNARRARDMKSSANKSSKSSSRTIALRLKSWSCSSARLSWKP